MELVLKLSQVRISGVILLRKYQFSFGDLLIDNNILFCEYLKILFHTHCDAEKDICFICLRCQFSENGFIARLPINFKSSIHQNNFNTKSVSKSKTYTVSHDLSPSSCSPPCTSAGTSYRTAAPVAWQLLWKLNSQLYLWPIFRGSKTYTNEK